MPFIEETRPFPLTYREAFAIREVFVQRLSGFASPHDSPQRGYAEALMLKIALYLAADAAAGVIPLTRSEVICINHNVPQDTLPHGPEFLHRVFRLLEEFESGLATAAEPPVSAERYTLWRQSQH